MTPLPRFSRLNRPDLAEKMDALVELDPVTGCWNWSRGVNAEGYGYGLYFDGKQTRAHRVAYLVTHGYLPPSDVFVCHLCNNPSCCNPAHLAEGTAWDNSQDATAAGRHRRSHKSARQRKADALAIRASNDTHAALAARLGVHISTVIRHRRRSAVKSEGNRKLTEADVRGIRNSDEPSKVLAERHGVTAQNIHAIRIGRTWRHVS